jgi:hypothetical protein
LGSFLVIRYDSADIGVRPIPSGDVWWVSPDIWIEGGDGFGNPVSGQACTVNARIWNLGGLQAMPTSVLFSFIEPGLAIPVTTPKPIGPGPVYALVPAGGYQVVSVPWVPPKVAGKVHTCLIVTCSCPMTNDAPSAPGNAVADRHTGQRNVTIIGDGATQMLNFSLTMTNLLPNEAEVALGARALWLTPRVAMQQLHLFDPLAAAGATRTLARPNTQLRYQLLGQRAGMLLDHAEAFEVSALSKSGVDKVVEVKHVAPGHRLRDGAVVPPRGRTDGSTSAITALGEPIKLKALQQARVDWEVALPERGRAQKYFVLHLFQMTQGAVDGGYTIVQQFAGHDAERGRRKRRSAEKG